MKKPIFLAILLSIVVLTSCKKDNESCTTQETEYNESLAAFTTFDSKTDGGQISGMVSQHNVPNDQYHWILIPTGTDGNGNPIYNDSVNTYPSGTIGGEYTDLEVAKNTAYTSYQDCQN